MQYSEVENHDDFYSFSGSSDVPVKVWDPQGVGIVYDAALEDLEMLENELLLVGSYYIQQDGGQKKPLKMVNKILSILGATLSILGAALSILGATLSILGATLSILGAILSILGAVSQYTRSNSQYTRSSLSVYF